MEESIVLETLCSVRFSSANNTLSDEDAVVDSSQLQTAENLSVMCLQILNWVGLSIASRGSG
jgi:hypothetical protein